MLPFSSARRVRIYHLASLHLLLAQTTPATAASDVESSSSLSTTKALLLLSRASLLLRQILSLPTAYPPSDLNPLADTDTRQLEEQIVGLEEQAKRALYEQTLSSGEGSKKFLDLAFNFVELERKEVVASVKSSVGSKKVEMKVVDSEDEGESEVEEREEDSEEEEEEEDEKVQEQGKKGWLGGWFGRK